MKKQKKCGNETAQMDNAGASIMLNSKSLIYLLNRVFYKWISHLLPFFSLYV